MTEAERQALYLGEFNEPGIFGLEWGDPESAPQLKVIRDEWIAPQLKSNTTVLEIGCGGGRWSRYLVGESRTVYLVDAIPRALELLRRAILFDALYRFRLAPSGELRIPEQSVDYIFSFDTFVHFHRRLFDRYLEEIARVAKPGACLHLHFACSIGDRFNAACFCYRDPEEVTRRCRRLGFEATGRTWENRYGYGAVLAEFVRS